MKISQKRAISYAYTAKKWKEAEKMAQEAKEKGVTFKWSAYPEVTKRRIRKAIEKQKV